MFKYGGKMLAQRKGHWLRTWTV